jgi:glucoamylase
MKPDPQSSPSGPSARPDADAPGRPGLPPTWSSSDKDLVGCALGPARLWFSVGHGIVNEVYYPRIDIPQIRDLGFIVADGLGFWVEVKRLVDRDVRYVAPGRPAVEARHRHPRFTLTLTVCPDPRRDVLLVRVRLEGDEALRPYALLAPHLGGTGWDNHAWVAHHRGRKVLWAEQGPFGLALSAADARQRDAWGLASAGYVGTSDGWQDFSSNGAMTWRYPAAGPGNVALTGELPREATLALGLGSSKESAATLAWTALARPFEEVLEEYVAGWEAWHRARHAAAPAPHLPDDIREQFDISATVLKVHRDKTYTGAMVASLSVPWGNTRDDRGGYHLVWPRDLVESASAFLALGAVEEAREVLRYLIATQEEDGHWLQNQWLGGKKYWEGIQLDETAFPVLLAATLAERGALAGIEVQDTVRRALSFVAREGPATAQDRWEEDSGVNTFTLAVCIAALVAGADFLEPADRRLALALADYWNAEVENWTAVQGTGLAGRLGVRGYYARVAPAPAMGDPREMRNVLPIKNQVQDPRLAAEDQVGVDFLQLVRFGLRRPHDPLIRDSLKAADALLRVETPAGPAWHRYSGDGYGEHDDGAPFDGTGRGRAWPLLTGERGHYELAAGNDPLPYLRAMARMAGGLGMLPEQVWDGAPIADRGLLPGRPSGSAMPLAWAHAEFIKLAVSRHCGVVFDRPTAVWERYHGYGRPAEMAIWSPCAPVSRVRRDQRLLLCLPRAALVRVGVGDWQRVRDLTTERPALGLHGVALDPVALDDAESVVFTFQWRDDGRWIGRDFRVARG